MPESEGSNVDTPTGESNTVSSSPNGTSDYDKWYNIGQKTEAAKDQGKSY